jgi:hypothetical protein
MAGLATAGEAVRAIRTGVISARELTEHTYHPIRQHNPKVNAFITLIEEQAMPRAREADEALATGNVWGPLYDEVIASYKERGVASFVREIVMVRVLRALPIDSPAYDLGLTEEQVRARWERHWQRLRNGTIASPIRHGGKR